MSGIKFGTDGIRGIANSQLTPELCFQIGQAAGRLIAMSEEPNRVVIGRDTRRSGPMLGAALAAGFCSAGVDAVTLGIVPTGLVSFAARTNHYGLGAVISASHNPAPDNGVKLIAHDGKKVSEDFEQRVQAFTGEELSERPTGGQVGALIQVNEDVDRYMNMLESIVPEGLEGLKVVIDCAHGAAYTHAPEILARLGAEVISAGCNPDGMNINEEGGATKPAVVQAMTVEYGADLGIALDGDADRAVFSDSKGRLINGDRTMALWCEFHKSHLTPPIVVGTVMSNGGFEHHMREIGIELQRVNVGDKYVSQRLHETGGKVGGEQSGHIIFPERGPTGDGLITMLEVLRVLKLSGRTSGEYFELFENWPQLLVNVNLDKATFASSETIRNAICEVEAQLGNRGRVNVRASGTQPIVRVMVEADDAEIRDEATHKIVSVMESAHGASVYSRVDLTHALGD
ncbi:MAG: phosphoglucosamine mutase [Armatimonadetes bacterium]|nr:phosphoglucosamine mutase [Armatimonadota bacterium]